MSAPRHPFPVLRWVALAWLAVYLPVYAQAYGWLNFLVLCNVGILLTAAGLVAGSGLLLSSQAVAALLPCVAWGLDVAWRLATGDFLFGGTAYMWDPQYPLAARLLSLYHLVWPWVLLHALRRLGYDPRGYALQCALAAALILGGRLVDPALNCNWAFADPLFARSFGPAPVHLATLLAATLAGVYLATHRLLLRLDGRLRDESATAARN